MAYDLAIDYGTVVTSHGRQQAHIYISEGRIEAIDAEHRPASNRIDAGGLFVLPGMIDGHCHFQEPGDTTREDFATGSSAAAVGGVTTVIEHTHSDPVSDPASLRAKVAHLGERSVVDFGLAAHATPANAGAVASLWRAGVTFFKVFTCTTHGVPAVPAGTMLRLFRELAGLDALCLVHCEDESITADNEALLRAAGRRDFAVIPEWRTREAEEVAVGTTTMLARMTGVRAIIAHVSHPAILDLIRREQQSGARLWAEACPHYFYLEEHEILEKGPFRMFTPPARSGSEGDLLWSKLEAGELSHISSDHAPSTIDQKRKGLTDIWQAPFGLPGVQTTLTMMLDGVSRQRLSLERLVEAYAERPAHLYGLAPRKGRIAVGADADFVLVDLTQQHTLRDQQMLSKAGWTPYDGRTVTGTPVMTILRGRVIAKNGTVLEEPGVGRYLPGPGLAA